jgi:hypothetical protein
MFVRWKQGETCGDIDGLYYSKRAYLVRSEWTPRGPRQRVVCYLGSIRQYFGEGVEILIGRWLKEGFWDRAMAALDRAGITGDDRAKVIAELKEVNPECHDEWVAELESDEGGRPLVIGDRQTARLKAMGKERTRKIKVHLREQSSKLKSGRD